MSTITNNTISAAEQAKLDLRSRELFSRHLKEIVSPGEHAIISYFEVLGQKAVAFPLTHTHPMMTTLLNKNVVGFETFGELSYLRWNGADTPHQAVIVGFQETPRDVTRMIHADNGEVLLTFNPRGGRLVVGVGLIDSHICVCCGKAGSKKCSRCAASNLSVRYCSGDCQKKHWAEHKKFCGFRGF